MVVEGSLVVYKNKPAIVKEKADGKFTISLSDGTLVKVRDKDIEQLHPGPVKNFNEIKESNVPESVIRETWELLIDEGASLSLKDLTSFVYNEYTPSSAYAAYCLLIDNLYFSGTISAITPRSKEEAAAEEIKRSEKLRETGERTQFLDQLKSYLKKTSKTPFSSNDERFPDKWSGFLQDVEALALGKSAKSRTMKDLGYAETPEDAHSVLLKTGFWTGMINPYPSRFGLSLNSANIKPETPPAEDRRDLTHLAAFAIDNSWSNDPDDAVSVEDDETGKKLYVHIADPAASIVYDSPVEKEARDRGATLYLPETAVRMLAEDSLDLFALGLSEKSLALSFKMTIDNDGFLIDTEIIPSVVKVRRMTYEEADRELDANSAQLNALLDLSQKIHNRRTSQGAVNIEFSDIHITIENEKINIEPIMECRSFSMIKELMIAAGEGAGTWAASRGLAFPYISQEVEIQGKIPGGLAGSYQLRRCMRPRILSAKPGRHQGLGLETYTHVTSPLRRYTDLLAHIQIRTILRGDKPLCADEISARLGFSEAAAAAAVQAERASENHWKMVYLSDKDESLWDAVALEKKGNRWVVIIPSLALETQVVLQKDVSPNENIKLILKSVNISKGEAVFVQADRH